MWPPAWKNTGLMASYEVLTVEDKSGCTKCPDKCRDTFRLRAEPTSPCMEKSCDVAVAAPRGIFSGATHAGSPDCRDICRDTCRDTSCRKLLTYSGLC